MHVQILSFALAILSTFSLASDIVKVNKDSIKCNSVIGQFCVKLEDDTYTYGLTTHYKGVKRSCTTVEGDVGKRLCLFYSGDTISAFCPGNQIGYVNATFKEQRSSFTKVGIGRAAWLSNTEKNYATRYDYDNTVERSDTLIVDCVGISSAAA